jgi:hypothetical protein
VAQDYSKELGLLRTIVRGMEARSVPTGQITHEYLRAERMALAHPVGDGVIVLNRAATDAFDDLSEVPSCLERGRIAARKASVDGEKSRWWATMPRCVGGVYEER